MRKIEDITWEQSKRRMLTVGFSNTNAFNMNTLAMDLYSIVENLLAFGQIFKTTAIISGRFLTRCQNINSGKNPCTRIDC